MPDHAQYRPLRVCGRCKLERCRVRELKLGAVRVGVGLGHQESQHESVRKTGRNCRLESKPRQGPGRLPYFQ
eukprot:2375774-Rhodomonas_salina.1